MKKQIKRFAALVLLVAAASCQKEFSFPEETQFEKLPPRFTIEASVDVHETRAFLDETGNIFWNSGDALAVFQGTGTEPLLFSTEEEGLSCKFNYSGDLNASDGDFYALYPYQADARCNGGVITTVLPTEQVAAPGSFGKDANMAVGFALFGRPMTFKNAAAYAKVSFKTTDENAAVTKITVRSLDESVLLSGSVTLTPTVENDEEGYPAVTNVALAVSGTDGVPYASVAAPSGSTLSPDTDYYIVLAPAALTSGYRVEFTTSTGLTFTKDYTGGTYNEATFQRNTIAPVGKKNLDKFETEGFVRVRFAETDNHPGAGNYLVAYKMADGSYRILNEERSDTYIVKGTHFELSGSNMVFDADYKRQQMEGMVAYVFRNAWSSSSVTADGILHADEELILTPEEKGISVDSYNGGTTNAPKPVYFANVILYNRTDNTQVTLTLDALTCSLGTSDEGTVSGKFNTKSASKNPNGNPNTCSDLVDALLKHASFSGYDSMVKNAAVSALKGDDNAFTGGFTTATHTTKNNIVCKDHFMIKTADLLKGAQISNIRLYKWGTVTYSKYINNQ